MKIQLLRASKLVKEVEFAATMPPLNIQRLSVDLMFENFERNETHLWPRDEDTRGARHEIQVVADDGSTSLYRQTAAFRPLQSWSLLDQAEEWERLAVAELEAYFNACNSRHDDQEPQVARYAEARWETALGREADMFCMRTAIRFESATVWAT